MKSILLLVSLLIATTAQTAAQGELQFAELGQCSLQNGGVILDCRIGYRTWGTLDANRSNAVLFPTWVHGTSENLARFAGPGGYVDTSRFFVIAVDVFGNGVSSSPSNSTRQPGHSFPQFTIRDMVDSQYRLLVEQFGIEHLWAVIGVSMGGMQALEWLVAYPDFVQKAVSISGSPQLTSYDLLLWKTRLAVIEQCEAAGCEDTGTLAGLMSQLAIYTPHYMNQHTSREGVERLYAGVARSAQASFHAGDHASQLRAMLAHDVAASFEGDLERAAATVKGELFTVLSTHDQGVTPEAARRFTDLVDGALLELDNDFGHMAFWLEAEIIGLSVKGFLAEGREGA